MFKQVFTSVPPPYRTASELGSAAFGAAYNPYLLVPPRLYAEEMASSSALYVQRERTPYSDFTIHLLGTTRITVWPSWDVRHWKFDGTTGAFLGYGVPVPPLALSSEVVEGSDGSLWIYTAWGQTWYEMNPQTLDLDMSSYLDRAKYGNPVVIEVPLVDRTNNLLIRAYGSGVATLRVYNFMTGAWIRDINVSGSPAQIMPESERHAYVYCNNGMLNLVDYVAGKVLSTFRAPAPTNTQFLTQLGSQRFAYDRFHRRLLAFQMVDNNADGSSASVIRGWYPVPQAVRMMRPIPLVAPRAGRKVPCLTRLFGDAGEPVAGVNVKAEAAGPGIVTTLPGTTNNNGEAIVYATGNTAGDITLDLSATVS